MKKQEFYQEFARLEGSEPFQVENIKTELANFEDSDSEQEAPRVDKWMESNGHTEKSVMYDIKQKQQIEQNSNTL